MFAGSALALTGAGIGGYNVVLEFAGGPARIPFFTSLFNGVIAPFRIIAPIAGGYLADHTRMGYTPLFALSALFALGGFIYTLRMEEPERQYSRSPPGISDKKSPRRVSDKAIT